MTDIDRDEERRLEIAELFGELQGETVEELCFIAHSRDLERRRENYRLNHARRAANKRQRKPRNRIGPRRKSGPAGLPDEIVRAIFRARGTAVRVAQRYGTTLRIVDNIRGGKAYKHVTCGARWPRHGELSEDLVLAMRAMAADGHTARQVSNAFGVKYGTARAIISRSTWAHLPPEQRPARKVSRSAKYRCFKARYDADPEFRAHAYEAAKRRYVRWLGAHPRPRQAKLAAAQVEEIRSLYQTGLLQTQLATLYGVSGSTISLLVKGKTWKQAAGAVVERAPKTHRLRPLVKCAAKVEANLAKKRERKRAKYAEDPEYFKRYERERRQRDPEAQRAKDRANYRQSKAEKMKAKYREKMAAETPEERTARLEKRRAISNRYYATHRDQILAKQAANR
jgi:hypothetical protein